MIKLIKHWRLVLLVAVGAFLTARGVQVRWLSDRLDKAQAREAAAKQELEAHETRNEVDNRIAADSDPKRLLRRDWSE